ncbi:universal stress protein [archaeon]|nr:universal stress protein [archaeon]
MYNNRFRAISSKCTVQGQFRNSRFKRKGINIIGIVREGDIADEILKIGKEMKCDLIVIGHKGVSKIGKFMLGSVAEKVVRYASRPVLVVR